jgi:hypothetical protein
MADLGRSLCPLRYPEWQRQYEAAFSESAREKLPQAVRAAELAILNRLHVLVGKGGHKQEQIAMSDALYALQYLMGSIAV